LEAWPFASVASEITYIVQERAFDFLDAPIQRITTADTSALFSSLIERMVANADDVIKAVKKKNINNTINMYKSFIIHLFDEAFF
jgi:pyruvate dehydrogenase E1 component beta subunit